LTNLDSSPHICLTPRLSGVGGMVSFQHKLLEGLAALGVEVTYDLNDPTLTAILVIGGTRQVPALLQARRRGIPVIQRLDGMNWMHRIRRTGWRHFLRAEYGNLLLRTIRRQIASRIVYQSEFSRRWWEQAAGTTQVPNTVIYNGVNLKSYHPQGIHNRPQDRYRILLVEGSLMGGYEAGLEAAVGLAAGIASRTSQPDSQLENRPVELMVVGKVAPEVQSRWTRRISELGSHAAVHIHWAGLVPRQDIPRIDRSAHLYYSADVNAACPNSVIEALACGLPVVAFDTGALPELVTGNSGRIVAYGGDPWRLEPPDIPALVHGSEEILGGQAEFRQAARERAENLFGLDQMVSAYLDQLTEK
jgi:glycosyltransferase involved in cell wall biosynthesis